jgi:excisionase family DNA binding protein
MDPDDTLLKPREAAEMLGVRPATVALWARIGALRPAVSTPGGHRRYRRGDVRAFVEAGAAVAADQARMEAGAPSGGCLPAGLDLSAGGGDE